MNAASPTDPRRAGPDDAPLRPPGRVRVVLASSSPRRLDLLRMLGLEPRTVDPGQVERSPGPGADPGTYAREQALAKLRAGAGIDSEALTLAADTVVVVQGRLLGKPRDPSEARRMLGELSGRSHDVLTGLAVRRRGRELSGVERTRVEFRSLEGPEMDRYVESGEPLDKAGAYGIQGRGASLVRRVEGCFFNVVGLPLALLLELLAGLGLRYDPGHGGVMETDDDGSGWYPR